jgi:hypothetical protein
MQPSLLLTQYLPSADANDTLTHTFNQLSNEHLPWDGSFGDVESDDDSNYDVFPINPQLTTFHPLSLDVVTITTPTPPHFKPTYANIVPQKKLSVFFIKEDDDQRK